MTFQAYWLPVSALIVLCGCATLPPDLNPLDYRNEEQLLRTPEGTSKKEFFRVLRKSDSALGQIERDGDIYEVFFYAFLDRFVSPSRQNYYLVSFKNGKLYRVVLAETQTYQRRPAFEQLVEAFRRR